MWKQFSLQGNHNIKRERRILLKSDDLSNSSPEKAEALKRLETEKNCRVRTLQLTRRLASIFSKSSRSFEILREVVLKRTEAELACTSSKLFSWRVMWIEWSPRSDAVPESTLQRKVGNPVDLVVLAAMTLR
ncbi:hypothetical protein TKK_0009476 [Trichogramma kaykai]